MKLGQPKAQADQQIVLLLWIGSSFLHVFLGIWILLFAGLFKFPSVGQVVYSRSGFNKYLLTLVLSQSLEHGRIKKPGHAETGEGCLISEFDPRLAAAGIQRVTKVMSVAWIEGGVRPQSDRESKCKMWQIWAKPCVRMSVLGQNWSLNLPELTRKSICCIRESLGQI